MQEKLFLLRKTSGVTQDAIAKMLDINPKTYASKEMGKTEFSMNEMFKIASYFNKHVEDIFLPTILQNGVNNKLEKEE